MESLLFPLASLKSPEDLLFEQDELGRLQAQIPFRELAAPFRQFKASGVQGGRPSHLSIEGGLALMFLKHYLGLSDAMLIARLNSDVYLQRFCFTRIRLEAPIRDKDLVGRWRRFFAEHLDMEGLQQIIAQHVAPKLAHTHVQLDDAVCYESDIKYPTDIKLLLDCAQWLHQSLVSIYRFGGLALPRFEKYYQAIDRVKRYQKMKRKPHVREKRLRRSLLYWVDHWQALLQQQLNGSPSYHQQLNDRFYQRLKTIRMVYAQQSYMLQHELRKVPHRIVSLYKPYIRPIIRGKERKPYEFGAKVHMSQVDGFNFIEHLSFEAFHEGNRMWYSIAKHKKRFGHCSHYAGDKIYATNRNRRKANQHQIQTSFARKGPKARDEKQRQQARSILARARATQLEGSFGTEKQHYGLARIRARTQKTEIAWIFFGIHTANFVRLTRRQANQANALPKARAA